MKGSNPHRGSSAIEWANAEINKDPLLAREVEIELDLIRLALAIKEMRKSRKLSQKTLAELTGTKQPAIARIEKGDMKNITVETLKKLAEASGYKIGLKFSPL